MLAYSFTGKINGLRDLTESFEIRRNNIKINLFRSRQSWLSILIFVLFTQNAFYF